MELGERCHVDDGRRQSLDLVCPQKQRLQPLERREALWERCEKVGVGGEGRERGKGGEAGRERGEGVVREMQIGESGQVRQREQRILSSEHVV